ncbi:MAG: glycosyltransferase [Nitrospirae bacterium]|nr:MAG: glycosyltransferase [Nitrospirota bacterium]
MRLYCLEDLVASEPRTRGTDGRGAGTLPDAVGAGVSSWISRKQGDSVRVTIITPTYNRADLLPETIESVLGQDYQHIEYIVFDDGSKDDTSRVLQRYAGKVRWERHPNMGETLTVNNGFKLATGDVVCVVNSGDPLLPGAVRSAVEALERNSDALAVYPNWAVIGPRGEFLRAVRATRDWLLEVKPDDLDATVITTYPGTPYFDEAIETSPGVWTYTYPKSGDRLHSLEVDYREVAEYYKGVPGEYTSYVYTDFLNAKELVKLRDWLEASVRDTLGIPYNSGAPAVRYEHSMGQGVIPTNILRTTGSAQPLPFK